MRKNIFILIICSIAPFMGHNFEIPQNSVFVLDSLRSYPPSAPGQNNTVPEIPSAVLPPTAPDSLAVYPKDVNPQDIPSNTTQNTETREAPKHIPPGGEEQLEQLKSKELPVTDDSSVTRVKPADK
jgi:hypothetical protein